MLAILHLLVMFVADIFKSRRRLEAENLFLRHQLNIALRRTPPRPRLHGSDRALLVWMTRIWPSLLDVSQVVKPETILRWHRSGFKAFWRWKSRNRAGRPKVGRELRDLIRRMGRENPLWGAPRIHGELLMLGFSVSQATVSRYMPPRSRRPEQSWRTFLRNQAMAFGHCEYSEEWQSGNAGPQSQSYSAQLERSGAAQIATVWVGRKRSFGRAQSTLSNRRIRLRSAECDRGVTHRAAYVSSGSRRALCNRRGTAFLIRSPPR